MGAVTVTTFVSLDGIMQAPGLPEEDPEGGFRFGGWQAPYAEDALFDVVGGWFTRAEAFLLGRRTYEIFATYWPRVTDENNPVASRLNALPKYVASTTLDHADWHNSTLIRNVATDVAALKRQYDGEIQVHGSQLLIQSLREYDLVDEYRLLIYPVLLGSGKRLFPEGGSTGALTLVESQTTEMGATINIYRPAGEVRTGSFALEDE